MTHTNESSLAARAARRSTSAWLAALLACGACIGLRAPSTLAADWQQWKYGATRSNASPHALPANLRRVWRIELPAPRPAWPEDQEKLAFDRVYEPIVVGQRLIVGSMTNDHLAAYDTRSGQLLWRFPVGGPVRFAAAAANERLYFVCDDGFLYCVSLDGVLVWRRRAGPSESLGIGNERLVSLWPARGAPVVADGVVYFAGSIWPFMGTFVYALREATGETVWVNSGTGADYVTQQHNSPAFAGVAPQGYLAVSGDRLIVPGGLTVPAVFQRQSGALRYFDPSSRVAGRDAGGYAVSTARDWYFNRTEIYHRDQGAIHGRARVEAILDDERLVHVDRDELRVRWLPPPDTKPVDPNSPLAKLLGTNLPQIQFPREASARLPRRFDRLGCVAGTRAYVVADDGTLAAVELPATDGPAQVVWTGRAGGRALRVIAGDDRLFVSTDMGALECFAPEGDELPLATVTTPAAAADASGIALLVRRGAEWLSWSAESAPPAEWMERDFADAAWKSLPVALDEDAPKKTVTVKEGEAPPPPPPEFTGYYRRSFAVAPNARFDDARISVIAPDRSSLYLDGELVTRLDVRKGTPVTGNTANPKGPKWASHEIDLDPRSLTTGRHVLALEVPRLIAEQRPEAFLLELAAEQPWESALDRPAPGLPARAPARLADVWGAATEAAPPSAWCVVRGAAPEEFVDALVEATEWRIVVLANDLANAEALRRRWIESGWLGRRVSVVEPHAGRLGLPPYFASVLFDLGGLGEDATSVSAARLECLRSLRPYGGLACVAAADADAGAANAEAWRKALDAAAAADSDWRQFQVEAQPSWTLVRRAGALPGAGDWTHQNANPANTLMSTDRRVKLPLGILWFGGPPNAKILPRHGHGPVPQVVDGRLIIEGPDLLRAVDVYTGQLLWERKLKGLGIYYNNTAHHAGAGAIGGNYVSTSDGIYVAYERRGLRLDPRTGRTLAEFTLPADGAERLRAAPPPEAKPATSDNAAADELDPPPPADAPPYWGHLAVFDRWLIATSTPTPPLTSSRFRPDSTRLEARFGEASRRLVAFDRNSGAVAWKRDAQLEFRHNAIVVGAAAGSPRVFCLDAMTDLRRQLLAKRHVQLDGPNTLQALDLATGQSLWSVTVDQPYTWLGYSAEHDLLLAAGSKFRDRATDEAGKGLVAYRGSTGEKVWSSDVTYSGPCLLAGARIITQGEAYDLLTGQRLETRHPLTSESLPWEWQRNYGCNTAVGCPNLLTFRSAAAGFFDLEGDGGTGNFGGFRSSCTNNLIPAGGLLNAPDYTRTCTCSYQNQTSLALVHRPDVEYWTFNPQAWSGKPLTRMGINLGAPGDRRADDGTLWLDFPSVGGKSPDVPLRIKDGQGRAVDLKALAKSSIQIYRQHASTMADPNWGWVTASGIRGDAELEITVEQNPEAPPKTYTVRLYFAEPEQVQSGQRIFDVEVQGRAVRRDLDVVATSGGVGRTYVEVVRGVEVRDRLQVSTRGRAGSLPPILGGVELQLEGSDSR